MSRTVSVSELSPGFSTASSKLTLSDSQRASFEGVRPTEIIFESLSAPIPSSSSPVITPPSKIASHNLGWSEGVDQSFRFTSLKNWLYSSEIDSRCELLFRFWSAATDLVTSKLLQFVCCAAVLCWIRVKPFPLFNLSAPCFSRVPLLVITENLQSTLVSNFLNGE